MKIFILWNSVKKDRGIISRIKNSTDVVNDIIKNETSILNRFHFVFADMIDIEFVYFEEFSYPIKTFDIDNVFYEI